MINRLLILCLLAFAMSCSNDQQTVDALTETITLPTESGKNVFINYTDSGLARARVYAPAMERYSSEEKFETIMPKGITIYFLDKNKKVESYMKAKYAIRYDRERKMTGKNNVVLVNAKGDTLKTEVLNWDEVTQKLYTDQYVRISTSKEIIEATGFESNTEFTKYSFKKISGVWAVDK